MNVLVTGAKGFIGRNLTARLRALSGMTVSEIENGNSSDDLRTCLESADLIFHLAGVNRAATVQMYEKGNAGFTRAICATLRSLRRAPKVVFSSSIQATLDNPYGVSKRRAEDILRAYAAQTGALVTIYRLKNVFGKWARPGYNSVVATFCHNIANNLPIHISDPHCQVELMYIDDVVSAFVKELTSSPTDAAETIPSRSVTLEDLANRIRVFHDQSRSLELPELVTPFDCQLYATYMSYKPLAENLRQLRAAVDRRGEIVELTKSRSVGQIFVSRTGPGITRGNHYHHTKVERFFVVAGEALIRMRVVDDSQVTEFAVSGENPRVVDIPPGCTHSIENVGAGDLITVFWSSEVFDVDRPDTYALPVFVPPARELSIHP